MSSGQIVNLLQITDTHLLSDDGQTMRGVNTNETFAQVMEMASPYFSDADAILLTGDIAQDELALTYATLVGHLKTLDTPIWSLPGNHDNPMEMSHLLDQGDFAYLGSHNCGVWEVIMLDSHLAGAADGLLGDDELNRLAKRLAVSSAQYFLVCLHHHPVPMSSKWLDTVNLKDHSQFQKIIEASGKVRGVLFGHVHQVSDQTVNSIRYLSSPSTCSQFKPVSDEFALDAAPPGFRCLSLHPDGGIETQVYWLNKQANS